MKKGALVEILIGEHNSRFDVASRNDGKWNIWKKMIEFNKDGTYSIFWSVIDVADSKSEAQRIVSGFLK